MLVGNKTDLQYLREVTTEEGREFAQREGMLFMETSANSKNNVEEAFTELVKSKCILGLYRIATNTEQQFSIRCTRKWSRTLMAMRQIY